MVGNPVLHKECRDVTDFGPDFQQLVADMFASQRTAEGVGLAANQIGVDLKVFVYDCPDDDGARHVGVVCNPELVELPAEKRRLDDSNEGCLSVPTAYAPLARPDYAEVTGQDELGNPVNHIETDHHRSSTGAVSPGDRGGVSSATPSVLAQAPGGNPRVAARKAAHAGGQGGGICRWTVLHGPHGGLLHRCRRRGPPGDSGLQRVVLRLGRPARPRHRARPPRRLAAAEGPPAHGSRQSHGPPASRTHWCPGSRTVCGGCTRSFRTRGTPGSPGTSTR
ncbi:Peptide deformylase [Streptomyces hirsutus]